MAGRHYLRTLLVRSARSEFRSLAGLRHCPSGALVDGLVERISGAARTTCSIPSFTSQTIKSTRISHVILTASRFSSSSSFAEDDLPIRETSASDGGFLRWEMEQRKRQQLLPRPPSSPQAMLLPSANSIAVEDREHDMDHEDSTTSRPSLFGEPTDIYIPVKAFFISRRINLKTLQDEQFLGTVASRNHLILKWKDRPPGCPPITGKLDMQGMTTWSTTRYIVVYNYGAVVLFNFGDNEEFDVLDIIRQHGSEQCQEAKNDDFDIIIRPTLEGWCQGGHDKVLLKKLNTDNIRIVSSILGQSVALDHYGRKVDALVTIFSDLNQKMEKTGTFTMKRSALFRVVATANTTLADVILRLGLLERSDAAWKNANYAVLWEFLREEYELDERFESFDFKVEIIQHNVRFFLEVLQNRKSNSLEWIIIFLIAAEICVSLYEIMHGSGVL
ncbi:hypothetical protein KP509_02G001100 [Ceratopteris richardii]|uniref:DUF155 domain-containing protein n=3 Tax=Ceratopteris richardii TaxID=49495 RepID=A0A8T2VAH6_CERRI|nr:hypothetical protein KP509_02G001100 [Ceratopteris richardii]KAH7442773.1 hypothetical protein KP509_02G001100 [Ceratopteris richardii]